MRLCINYACHLASKFICKRICTLLDKTVVDLIKNSLLLFSAVKLNFSEIYSILYLYNINSDNYKLSRKCDSALQQLNISQLLLIIQI